jgi:hypothetical protein
MSKDLEKAVRDFEALGDNYSRANLGAGQKILKSIVDMIDSKKKPEEQMQDICELLDVFPGKDKPHLAEEAVGKAFVERNGKTREQWIEIFNKTKRQSDRLDRTERVEKFVESSSKEFDYKGEFLTPEEPAASVDAAVETAPAPVVSADAAIETPPAPDVPTSEAHSASEAPKVRQRSNSVGSAANSKKEKTGLEHLDLAKADRDKVYFEGRKRSDAIVSREDPRAPAVSPAAEADVKAPRTIYTLSAPVVSPKSSFIAALFGDEIKSQITEGSTSKGEATLKTPGFIGRIFGRKSEVSVPKEVKDDLHQETLKTFIAAKGNSEGSIRSQREVDAADKIRDSLSSHPTTRSFQGGGIKGNSEGHSI